MTTTTKQVVEFERARIRTRLLTEIRNAREKLDDIERKYQRYTPTSEGAALATSAGRIAEALGFLDALDALDAAVKP